MKAWTLELVWEVEALFFLLQLLLLDPVIGTKTKGLGHLWLPLVRSEDVGCCLCLPFLAMLSGTMNIKMYLAKLSPSFFFHSLNKYLSAHGTRDTVAFIPGIIYFFSENLRNHLFIHSLECIEHLWVSVTELSSICYQKNEKDTALPFQRTCDPERRHDNITCCLSPWLPNVEVLRGLEFHPFSFSPHLPWVKLPCTSFSFQIYISIFISS